MIGEVDCPECQAVFALRKKFLWPLSTPSPALDERVIAGHFPAPHVNIPQHDRSPSLSTRFIARIGDLEHAFVREKQRVGAIGTLAAQQVGTAPEPISSSGGSES